MFSSSEKEIPSGRNRFLSSARHSDLYRLRVQENHSMLVEWLTMHSTSRDILNLKQNSSLLSTKFVGCRLFSLSDLLRPFLEISPPQQEEEQEVHSMRESEQIVDVDDITGDTFYFMAKWSSHWNLLSMRNSYSVASKCPSLHYSIELLFRADTLSVMSLLVIYYVTSQGVLWFYYGNDMNMFEVWIVAVLWIGALLVAHVVRGSLFDSNSATQFVHKLNVDLLDQYAKFGDKRSVGQDGSSSEKQSLQDLRNAAGSARVALRLLFKLVFGNLLHSLRSLFFASCKKDEPHTAAAVSSYSEVTELDGYYHLLEVGTRYLDNLDDAGNERVLNTSTDKIQMYSWIVFPSLGIYAFINRLTYVPDCFDDETVYDYCPGFVWQTYLSLFWIIPLFAEVLLYMVLSTSLLSLYYGSGIACGLSYNWIMRYASLRRVTLLGDDEGDSEGNNEHSTDFTQLSSLIERDAFERYLFVQHFFTSASRLWSNVLFSTLFLACGAIIYIYVSALWQYSETGTFHHVYIIALFFACFIVYRLIFTMMHANSAVDLIREGLVNACKDDFKLIGSRADWIEFIDEAPCYWYILGFAITRSWMVGFLGGATTAIIGGVVMSMVE